MKININGNELEMHYSMRILILYENIAEKSLDAVDLSSLSNMIILFYSAVVATCKYNKLEYTPTYDNFIDWVDENGGQQLLYDFSIWFKEEVDKQTNLSSKLDYNKGENKNKKTKVKNS